MKSRQWFWTLSGWILAVVLGVLLWGAPRKAPTQPAPPPADVKVSEKEPTTTDLLDKNYAPVAQDEPGWDYKQTVAADLDGDGTQERVVIMARVERSPDNPGEYLWDDGQPWQVLVESSSGDQTPVYSRWVQIGQLKGFISEEKKNGGHDLILLELTGAGVSLYRVEYDGPRQVTSTRLATALTIDQAGPVPLP